MTPYGCEWSSNIDFDPPFEGWLEDRLDRSLSGLGFVSPAVQSMANLISVANSFQADCYNKKNETISKIDVKTDKTLSTVLPFPVKDVYVYLPLYP